MRLDKANSTKKLPGALHKEMQDLFKYLWSQETTFLFDYGIIEKMPFRLKRKILDHMFNDFVSYFKVLFKKCEIAFIYEFVIRLMPH